MRALHKTVVATDVAASVVNIASAASCQGFVFSIALKITLEAK
jgi:hypothetical protein